jgi:hypothetical protein
VIVALRRRSAHAVTAVLLATGVIGCGSQAPSSLIVPSSPSASTSSAIETPSPPSSGAVGAGSPAQSSSGPSVALDESLLAVLPPDVEGIAVQAEPDAFAEAAADPDFARNVERAAFGVVVDGGDLATGVVAALRAGAYSAALFRDWRDTYNDGACAQAGGVARTAQAELGGRTVHIATCEGGLRVYHAYLPERAVIVSLFSLGDRRFGEQLMRDLRP